MKEVQGQVSLIGLIVNDESDQHPIKSVDDNPMMIEEHRITGTEMADPPQGDQLCKEPPKLTNSACDKPEANLVTKKLPVVESGGSISKEVPSTVPEASESVAKPINLAKSSSTEDTSTTDRSSSPTELVSHIAGPGSQSQSASPDVNLDEVHGLVYPFRGSHFVTSFASDDGTFVHDMPLCESEEEDDDNTGTDNAISEDKIHHGVEHGTWSSPRRSKCTIQ